ncbi:7 transmembrane receptor (rhodopsin family) domain-containing protein [Ditylenchus destructor]|nr:7 transmembrane receptor (rhodopsin family) domain-containing protein [Ditylenchus destructor]
MDDTSGEDVVEVLESMRQPWSLATVYITFYLGVFVAGLIGNVFVVLAVVLFNSNLRTTTDYLISSLALADLLIILFCLPTTLLNNLLTEWQLGAIGCKLSTFINSTTSCASIFTLVAVTADRYMAICHTLKYTLWEARPILYMICGLWVLSALLASPNLVLYDEILYDLLPPNGTLVARLCVSTQDDFLHFIIVNLIIAFLVPVILISVSYALIFRTVTSHQSLAVDARIRDERIKLRVAQMMLTVIIVFIICWSPLYGLYCYFFLASNRDSPFFQFASSVLRPIFQWLSLLSSSLNPLIYSCYSQKYRRAFHQLLLLPCRMHYQSFQRATRATLRLPPKHKATESSLGDLPQLMLDPSKYGRKVSLQHHYFQPHQYSNGLLRKMSEQSSRWTHHSNGTNRKFTPSAGVGWTQGLGYSTAISPLASNTPINPLQPDRPPPKPARRRPHLAQMHRHSLAVPPITESRSVPSEVDFMGCDEAEHEEKRSDSILREYGNTTDDRNPLHFLPNRDKRYSKEKVSEMDETSKQPLIGDQMKLNKCENKDNIDISRPEKLTSASVSSQSGIVLEKLSPIVAHI